MAIMISSGNSTTARHLTGLKENLDQHRRQTEVFGRWSMVSELARVCIQCDSNNWDGEGALAVAKSTAQYALAFIYSFPFGLERPTIGVEPDGHITFEWYRHPRWIASISISPEGMLYYAGLFGVSKVNGAEPFSPGTTIPTPVLDLIQRTIMSHVES